MSFQSRLSPRDRSCPGTAHPSWHWGTAGGQGEPVRGQRWQEARAASHDLHRPGAGGHIHTVASSRSCYSARSRRQLVPRKRASTFSRWGHETPGEPPAPAQGAELRGGAPVTPPSRHPPTLPAWPPHAAPALWRGWSGASGSCPVPGLAWGGGGQQGGERMGRGGGGSAGNETPGQLGAAGTAAFGIPLPAPAPWRDGHGGHRHATLTLGRPAGRRGRGLTYR